MNVLISQNFKTVASKGLDLGENETDSSYITREEIAGRYRVVLVAAAGSLIVWGISSAFLP